MSRLSRSHSVRLWDGGMNAPNVSRRNRYVGMELQEIGPKERKIRSYNWKWKSGHRGRAWCMASFKSNGYEPPAEWSCDKWSGRRWFGWWLHEVNRDCWTVGSWASCMCGWGWWWWGGCNFRPTEGPAIFFKELHLIPRHTSIQRAEKHFCVRTELTWGLTIDFGSMQMTIRWRFFWL